MIATQRSAQARRAGAARLLLTACAAALALGALGGVRAAAPEPEPVPPPAPDFTLRTLAGPNLRLHELRGRVVLLNFWASHCVPCREQWPDLNRLQQRHGADGLVLLGIAVDGDAAKAAQAAQRQVFDHPVLFDTDKQVARAYALDTLPSVYLVDRDGRLRQVLRGHRATDAERLEAQVRALLKE